MSAEVIDINERARDAWDAYLYAKEKAEATGDFRDARKAGLAWGRFLDLYSPDRDDRGAVLQFRQRENG